MKMCYLFFFILTVLAVCCKAGVLLPVIRNVTGLVGGDMVFPTSPKSNVARGAVCHDCGRWLKHTDDTYHVPYEYGADASFSASDLKKFDWSYRYFESVTNIKFVKHTTQKDFVSMVTRDGCWASAGRVGLKQEMSIGPGCEHITVINHELGHVFGLGHEQNRPDAEDYITIWWENIIPGYEIYLTPEAANLTAPHYSAYDIASGMHYGTTAYAKGPGLKTMTSKIPGLDKIMDGMRLEMSICDITELNLMYPGKKKPPICVPNQVPTGFEPIPAYRNDPVSIERCQIDNEWISQPNGGTLCQTVGGGYLPPIPPGILSEETTAKPTTTTRPTTTTTRPTTTTTRPTPVTTFSSIVGEAQKKCRWYPASQSTQHP